MRKQAAEMAKRSSEWAAREVQLSAAHTRSHGGAAAARAELAATQVHVVLGGQDDARAWQLQISSLCRRTAGSSGLSAALKCPAVRSGPPQDKLDAATKRVRALDAENAELKRQKAQVGGERLGGQAAHRC